MVSHISKGSTVFTSISTPSTTSNSQKLHQYLPTNHIAATNLQCSKELMRAFKLIEAIRPYITLPQDNAVCERENCSTSPAGTGSQQNDIFLDDKGKLIAFKNYGTEIYVFDDSNQTFTPYSGTYYEFSQQYEDLQPFTLAWGYKNFTSVSPNILYNLNSENPTDSQTKVLENVKILMSNLRAGAVRIRPPKATFDFEWLEVLSDPKTYPTKDILKACQNPLPFPASPAKKINPNNAATSSTITIVQTHSSTILSSKSSKATKAPSPITVIKEIKSSKVATGKLSFKQKISQATKVSTKSLKSLSIKKQTCSCSRFLRAIGRFFKNLFKKIY